MPGSDKTHLVRVSIVSPINSVSTYKHSVYFNFFLLSIWVFDRLTIWQFCQKFMSKLSNCQLILLLFVNLLKKNLLILNGCQWYSSIFYGYRLIIHTAVTGQLIIGMDCQINTVCQFRNLIIWQSEPDWHWRLIYDCRIQKFDNLIPLIYIYPPA